MQVEVSFERWKQLTALLRSEEDSFDAVIGRLLSVDGGTSSNAPVTSTTIARESDLSDGAYFKDVFLPNGTELRATHKGKTYFAIITDSRWLDAGTRIPRSSPSQAAFEITKTTVNGWRFWLVKRPNDTAWRSLSSLRAS